MNRRSFLKSLCAVPLVASATNFFMHGRSEAKLKLHVESGDLSCGSDYADLEWTDIKAIPDFKPPDVGHIERLEFDVVRGSRN